MLQVAKNSVELGATKIQPKFKNVVCLKFHCIIALALLTLKFTREAAHIHVTGAFDCVDDVVQCVESAICIITDGCQDIERAVCDRLLHSDQTIHSKDDSHQAKKVHKPLQSTGTADSMLGVEYCTPLLTMFGGHCLCCQSTTHQGTAMHTLLIFMRLPNSSSPGSCFDRLRSQPPRQQHTTQHQRKTRLQVEADGLQSAMSWGEARRPAPMISSYASRTVMTHRCSDNVVTHHRMKTNSKSNAKAKKKTLAPLHNIKRACQHMLCPLALHSASKAAQPPTA